MTSHLSVKSRLRACLNSMSRTDTMQCLTHSYHHFGETHFNARFDVNNAIFDVKSQQSHSRAKSRSRALGHSACFKSMPMTITVQGLTLTAIITSEKRT